jgi:hypothetical protein
MVSSKEIFFEVVSISTLKNYNTITYSSIELIINKTVQQIIIVWY